MTATRSWASRARTSRSPSARCALRRFGHGIAAPLGVAAGPHSQLAQNIVSSWLCGARFIELKTVQILDEIEVSRPCIDVADEGYNCEWSQELKLEESFREYLNAWVLLHALAHRMGLRDPGTHFNMSVGYDLKGIQTPRVQAFIRDMREPGPALEEAILQVARVYPAVRGLDIPASLSNHITLSTMHGCPPAEIEKIATFLLTELGVHTWVKLNPTLLGPRRLRGLLNETQGFDIEVPDSAFEHDPKFFEAMAMVRNLEGIAAGLGLEFGLKLTNTLEVLNHRTVFPPSEKQMYLSGRALHPLTLALAQQVSEALDGRVPLSFCGGADAGNFADLVADGLSPVTVCTDLLKPGGYARLQQYLVNLEAAMDRAGAASLDEYVQAVSGGHGARFNLARHAVKVEGDDAYARRPRPLEFKGERPLGHFDCIFAPCTDGLPHPPEHPRLPLAGGARQAGRGHGGDPPDQPPARHHRQRLRPSLHREVRAHVLRRASRHPRDQALRLRVRRGPSGTPGQPEPGEGGHRRRRPRRAFGGLLPGQAGLHRRGVRSQAGAGRHGQRRHPGLSPDGRGHGGRPGPAGRTGRPVPPGPGPGPRRVPGGPAQRLPLRLPGRGRPEGQAPGHPGRRRPGRRGRPGVPGPGAVRRRPWTWAGACSSSAAATPPWTRRAAPGAWSRTAR